MDLKRALGAGVLLLAACSSNNGVAGQTQALLPGDDKLCDVWMGYEIGKTVVLGTHIDDVRAVLGEPSENTGTEFTYTWCVGADCAKHASAVLTFTEADRCYASSGKPITPPMWLHDITIDGFTRPQCWVVGSEMPQLCTECLPPDEAVVCK